MSSMDSLGSVAGTQNSPYYGQAQSIRSTVLTAAASALGLDQTTLQSDLQSGQSLAQIAQKQGVSADDLTSAISQALQQSAGSNGMSLSPDAAQQIAQTAVNRTGGGHHHHHHPQQTQSTDDSSSSSSSDSPFSVLAGALGMSQDDLLTSLEQGQTLNQIATNQGVSLDDITSQLDQGSLFDTTA